MAPVSNPKLGLRATLTDWLSRLGRLVRHSPHVLLVPCALFAMMVGLGLFGVIKAHKESIELSRANALIEADSAVQAFQNMLQKASLPIRQIAELIPLIPNKQALQRQWDVSAASWWLGTIPGSIYLGLAPLGVFDYLYMPPNVPAELEATLGVDSLKLYPQIEMGFIIPGKKLTFGGPVTAVPGVVFCIFELPIFISNVTEDERWGHTVNNSYCPPQVCYDARTRTKWWGHINMGVDLSWLLSSTGPLGSLVRKKYSFQIWAAPLPGTDFEGRVVSVSGKSEPENDPLVIDLPVITQAWELHVWKDNWATPWILPLIAAVAAGALLVSALVFSTLYSWEEHRVLLHSLLPKETIDRMRQEARWASAQDEEAMKTARLETPAEIMLRIIDENLAERTPAVTLLLAVREALQRSADVYRPTEKQMQDRMNELSGMDDDVRKALTAQLLGQGPGEYRSGHSVSSTAWSSLEITDLKHASSTMNLSHRGSMLATEGTQKAAALEDGAGNADDGIRCVRFNVGQSNEDAQPGLARQLVACAPLMADIGMDEELTMALSRWVLQSPAVATLVQAASSEAAVDLPPAAADCSDEAQAAAAGDQLATTHQGTDRKPGEPAMAAVLKPVLTRLEQVLVGASEWGFDAFALDEASHGRPLSCLGFWLLQSTGLKSWAHMSTKKLVAFLDVVEAGYRDNPYHNSRHAADVLQSVHVIMHRSGMVHEYADRLTLLGCYLAAIVHDYEHVGCSNDFLVNSSDTLAVRYNDRSPMENHHLAAAWALLKTKGLNILGRLPKADVGKLRKLVIDLVLSTDMKQHFAIHGQFETLHRPHQDGNPSNRGRSSKATSTPGSDSECGGEQPSGPKPLNEQDRLLSLQMMLKCADLGHIAAPLPVHLKWVSALESELFLQGDKEKELGIPISPLCDRTKEGVTKSQLGFFDFVVLPLYKSFSNQFTGAGPMLKEVLNNLSHWKMCAQHAGVHGRSTPRSSSTRSSNVRLNVQQTQQV